MRASDKSPNLTYMNCKNMILILCLAPMNDGIRMYQRKDRREGTTGCNVLAEGLPCSRGQAAVQMRAIAVPTIELNFANDRLRSR